MTEWWTRLSPAEAIVPCGGATHRLRWEAGALRAIDHADPEGERTLAALAGESCPCLDLLDAWARHEHDVRVLVLGARGASDELTPGEEWFGVLGAGSPGPPTAFVRPARGGGRGGMVSQTVLARASGRGQFAPLRGVSKAQRAERELVALLGLGGGVADRLAATVAAHWQERLERRERGLARVRPQLHAALYGRALASLRPWLGSALPELAVELIGARRRPSLTRTDGIVRAQLPFRWLLDVHAQGLAVIWGRFCLAAETDDGATWKLTTVGPDLGTPERVTLQLS